MALEADECQIYTDVDGVFTTDPRVYDKARLLKEVSFEEMLELFSSGAKVLQLRSVEYAANLTYPLESFQVLMMGRELWYKRRKI